MNRMVGICVIAVLVLVVVVAGCLPIGDGAGRVRGEIVVGGETSQHCKLTLFLEQGDLEVGSSMVSGEFQTEFVLDPSENAYYVTVSCPKFAEQYRSAVIELGSIEEYRTGVNLGVIDMRSMDKIPE